MAPWLVDAVEYLEEHEEECKPFFTEANCRAFNWVKYYEAPRGSLPRNFIAVGDAMVTLNPNGGTDSWYLCNQGLSDVLVKCDSLWHFESDVRRCDAGRMPSQNQVDCEYTTAELLEDFLQDTSS